VDPCPIKPQLSELNQNRCARCKQKLQTHEMFTGLSEFIAMHIIDLIGVPKRILRGKVKNSLADAAAVESAEKILIMVQYLYPDLRFLLVDSERLLAIRLVIKPVSRSKRDQSRVVQSPSGKSEVKEIPGLLRNTRLKSGQLSPVRFAITIKFTINRLAPGLTQSGFVIRLDKFFGEIFVVGRTYYLGSAGVPAGGFRNSSRRRNLRPRAPL